MLHITYSISKRFLFLGRTSNYIQYYHFGPLEWIWRNLSYLKKHQLKK
ncbi:MAG: DUF418 domain-containing protein [Bacteroidetes bacterium]|nr:DUF418 domain-containing protein [Bacteroidota bacterium]